MAQKTLCRLCRTSSHEFKCLIDDNGQLNGVYKIAVKYFDPMVLYPGNDQTSKVICLDCWQQINNFYIYQQSVINSQSQLEYVQPFVNLVKLEDQFPKTMWNQRSTSFSIHDFIDPDANVTNTSSASVSVFDLIQINDKPTPNQIDDLFHGTDMRVGHENNAFIANRMGYLECVLCNKEKFATYSLLSKHFREKHSNIKCHIICCGRKLVERWRIVDHIRQKHNEESEKSYQCLLCTAIFSQNGQLEAHILKIHSGNVKQNEYKCKICLTSFGQECMLQEHYNFKHKDYRKPDNILENYTNNSNNEVGPSQEKQEQLMNINDEIFQSFIASTDDEEESQENEPTAHILDDIPDSSKNPINEQIPLTTNAEKSDFNDMITKPNFYSENYSTCDAFIKKYKGDIECPKCEVKCSNFSLLSKHFKTEHPTERPYTICCNLRHISRSHIYAHLLLHVNPNVYQCSICKRKFNTDWALKSHKRRIHDYELWPSTKTKVPLSGLSNDKRYRIETDDIIAKALGDLKCFVCKKTFSTLHLISMHFKVKHRDKKFHILCCGRKLTMRCRILKHIREKHNKENKKKYDVKESQENERESQSSVVMPTSNTNQIDEQIQLTSNAEQSEFNENNEGDIQNDDMTKTFNFYSVKNLSGDAFIKKIKGDLECPKCNVMLANFSSLNKHFKTEHPTERPYTMCCNLRHISRSHIYAHLLLHENPNAYQCSICERKFKTNWALKLHKKNLHDNKRLPSNQKKVPLSGPRTDKRYRIEADNTIAKTKVDLECFVCKKTFPALHLLSLHFKIKHKDKKLYINCCGLKLTMRHHMLKHIREMHVKENIKYNEVESQKKERQLQCPVAMPTSNKNQTDEQIPLTSNAEQSDFNENNQGDIQDDDMITKLNFYSEKKLSRETSKKESIKYDEAESQEKDRELQFSATMLTSNKNQIDEQVRLTSNTEKSDCNEINQYDIQDDAMITKLNFNSEKNLSCDAFIKKYKGDLECPKCNVKFSNFLLLSQHFKTEHPTEKPYIICCNLRHTNRRHLYAHLLLHVNPNAYQCSICERKFKTDSNLKSHVRRVHDNNLSSSNLAKVSLSNPRGSKRYRIESDNLIAKTMGDLQCLVCKKTFSTFHLLSLHFKVKHKGKQFHINCCGRKLTLRWHIVKHIRAKHNEKESQEKEAAAHGFTDIPVSTEPITLTSDAQEDIQDDDIITYPSTCLDKYLSYDVFIKKNKGDLECPKCKVKCSNFSLLSKHFKTEHPTEKPYIICCNLRHFSRGHLYAHLLLHVNPNAYQCSICERKFKTDSNLKIHVRHVHDNNLSSSNLAKVSLSNPRGSKRYRIEADNIIAKTMGDLECFVCKKTFSTLHLLSIHFKLKHKDKQFHLNCCGRKLTMRWRLLKHIREMHNEENIKYKCPSCSKIFSKNCELKKHIYRWHKKKYKCDKCSAAYVRKDFFMAHYRKNHNEYPLPEKHEKKDNFDQPFIDSTEALQQLSKENDSEENGLAINIHDEISQCSKDSAANVDIFPKEEADPYISIIDSIPNNQIQISSLDIIDIKKEEMAFSSDIDSDTEQSEFISSEYNEKQYDEFIKKWKDVLECPKCKVVLENFSSLCEHFETEHPNDRPHIVCCNLRHFTHKCLWSHLRLHINPNAYQCSICERKFENKSYLYKHKRNVHDEEACFDTDSDTEKSLLMTSNNEDTQFVKNSNSSEERKQNYDEFIKKHKGNVECPKCSNVMFEKYSLLEEHFQTEHSPERTYVYCCNLKHSNRNILCAHLRLHVDPNVYQCSICEKRFTSTWNLNTHKSHVHDGERYCSCQTKAYQLELLNMKYDTTVCCKRKETLLKNDATISQWKNELDCSICEEKFSYFSRLRNHFHFKHPREKFYLFCCKRKLVKLSDVLRHIRTHNDRLSLKCTPCNLSFFNRYHMRRHMLKVHNKDDIE